MTVEGVYTHFPSTYGDDAEFTDGQIETFKGIIDTLKAEGIEFPMIHTANSAAITQHKGSHFNMVRPGGMIYGMFPARDMNGVGLERVMSFKSRVVNVKQVARGKSVVGEGIFTHESGIHIDGVLKEPSLYEPYDPAMVGATRRIVFGKSSGPRRRSVIADRGMFQ